VLLLHLLRVCQVVQTYHPQKTLLVLHLHLLLVHPGLVCP
jgi:hypothetical protein